jgi:hypothetical protein
MMGLKATSGTDEITTGKKSITRSMYTNAEDGFDYGTAFRSCFEQGDGVIMMAVRDLFRQITLETDKKFVVSCSFLEIYNDSVHDLLTTTERLGEELPIIEKNVGQSNEE